MAISPLLYPFITLAISTGIILKSLTFNINIVHIYPSSWGFSRASSRTHSLVMGRTSSESRRRTRAERTRSSAPQYVSITRPVGQLLRGVVCLLSALNRSPGHSFGVDAIIRAYQTRFSTSGHEPVQAVDERVSIQRIGCLYVYCSSREACKEASVSFFSSPAPFDSKGTEVVHTYTSECRLVWGHAV